MNNDIPKRGDVESITPYNDSRAKTGQVEQMFDAIAPAYDLMNTAMTFGLHKYWRNKALKIVAGENPKRILDVATGTGDVAFELFRRTEADRIVGLDISEGMLRIARRKLADSHQESMQNTLSFIQADSLAIPFGADSFDAVTVAYGVRNFERLEEGLREMSRVLRPGGLLCVIELSEPQNPFTHTLYRLYSRKLIPLVGRLVSGDSRAYSYLPESIAAAPQRDDLTDIMERAGLSDATWRSLTFGAVTIYTARKPQ